MKRKIALMLTTTLVATSFTGLTAFANEESSSIVTEAGTFPIVTEPTTIKVFLVQPANVSSLDDRSEERRVGKECTG